MLGIRHYNKTAIDLWQGDSRQFVYDRLVEIPAVCEAASLHMALRQCEESSHVAITYAGDLAGEPLKIMKFVQDYLDQTSNPRLRRITFVLRSLEQYWTFQEALFATFLDE